MKKLILGCVYFFSGFIGLMTISIVHALYPYSYSWEGSIIFLGFLSNSHMTFLFLLSIILFLVGALISWSAVYKDNEKQKSNE